MMGTLERLGPEWNLRREAEPDMRNSGTETGTAGRILRGTSGRFARESIVLISLTLLGLVSVHAAPPVRFAGAVSGLVMDSAGKPQPGAMISLFNQQDRFLQKAYTDLSGNFSFGELVPDFYSVHVALASFVPAARQKVQVKPGMRSLLAVSLSRVFSSIQVVSSVPAAGGLMSDDWKWTLRADSSLRPVLRLFPSAPGASQTTSSGGARTAVFHDSSALVRISATDTALTDAAADEADMGTQFAFATSLYDRSQVQVSGNLGYASTTGQPAAAFRTTFSHSVAGDTPSVSLMMRQMSVPTRVGQMLGQSLAAGGGAGEAALPTLRTLSVSMNDKVQLSDALSLAYGSELDSISFLNRMQYFSPWAKVSYALPHGRLDLVFTSGNAQPDLDSGDPRSEYANDGLQNELAALSLLPRFSEMGGQVKVQRGDDYEIGYSDVVGEMEYRISGYHQYVSNSALMIANPDGNLFSGDLLPSMFSSSALFDAGSISTSGYTVSATRTLSQNYKVMVAYGTLGVMSPGADSLPITDAASLREAMVAADRRAVTVRSTGVVKSTGTRYVASYQYAGLDSAIPMANFSTQPDRAEPGLNIALRQPIAFIRGMAGHIEATAEMRNLLAEGYLPLAMSDGRQILIVNNPRVFRGGLAFIF